MAWEHASRELVSDNGVPLRRARENASLELEHASRERRVSGDGEHTSATMAPHPSASADGPSFARLKGMSAVGLRAELSRHYSAEAIDAVVRDELEECLVLAAQTNDPFLPLLKTHRFRDLSEAVVRDLLLNNMNPDQRPELLNQHAGGLDFAHRVYCRLLLEFFRRLPLPRLREELCAALGAAHVQGVARAQVRVARATRSFHALTR
jgi:hypothetical protein